MYKVGFLCRDDLAEGPQRADTKQRCDGCRLPFDCFVRAQTPAIANQFEVLWGVAEGLDLNPMVNPPSPYPWGVRGKNDYAIAALYESLRKIPDKRTCSVAVEPRVGLSQENEFQRRLAISTAHVLSRCRNDGSSLT